MSRVGAATFSDPGDFQSNIAGTEVNLVFTGGGDFKARLTSVELQNLHLFHSQESLPRIAYVSLPPKRVFVSFATQFDPPPVCGGIELQLGDLVFHSRGERLHQRTSGSSQWAFISLTPEHLAKYGKALSGIDLVAPPARRVLRPPMSAAAHLRRVHAKACRLSETKPNIIAHSEVERALEQDLVHALVNCLTADDAYGHAATMQHHADIMVRLEEVLAAHCGRQLPMLELCVAVGVPERTLRICCAEILGMAPRQYGRLRRLNMVRAVLRRADVAGTSIAQIGARYGFTEPGRLAVLYRTVFGETPSTTLQRPPLN